MAKKKNTPTDETKPTDDELQSQLSKVGPYQVWETDADLEAKGVWFDLGTFDLKCRPAGEANPVYMAAYRQRIEPIREALDKGLLTDAIDIDRRAMAEAYAETVIVDARRNWVNREGEPLDIKDQEATVTVLLDLPRMFDVLRRRCLQIEHYRVENDQATGKE